MTPQEALTHLRNWYKKDKTGDVDSSACVVAFEALEKQIPKKPIIKNIPATTYTLLDFCCPLCNYRIISKLDEDYFSGSKDLFCENCGQALDWSEPR